MARIVKEEMYSIEPIRVADIPSRQRPREQFERMGAESVSEDVLIALILRSGVQGMNVVDLARGLIRQYGSLTELAKASVEDLSRTRGMGKVKAQVLKASLELAKRLSEESAPTRHTIRSPEDAAGILRERMRTREEESFWVLLLDGKNRLMKSPIEVTRGLLDASLVHPREVFKEAIRSASAAVVLAHNHPSGDPNPSVEDIRITKQLVEAGRIVDIHVLDHVVMGRQSGAGGSDFFSFREAGIVEFRSKD
jgi:DNA repair protein RadC